jgi:hypothetical protein
MVISKNMAYKLNGKALQGIVGLFLLGFDKYEIR